MKPQESTATVTSTVQGASVQMGIDAAATAHIMGVLTDLYKNPELAIIREYSTNALDSHIEAGITRPIEVELPTPLRPQLIIRDFGVGLDKETIEKIYSQYGASTKRGSNDAVGMLGLGCKSALAYSDQFSLVGFKDGQRIMVSISRSADGGGTMEVVERGETDRENGAEILIPIAKANRIEQKAHEFFAFWAPGTVLVNGKAPKPVDPIMEAAEGKFKVIHSANMPERDRFRVLMGNVSYPVPTDYRPEVIQALPSGRSLLAEVDIGTVYFTPSREALQDHPATRAALDQIVAEFEGALKDAMREQIAEARTRTDALVALRQLGAAMGQRFRKGAEWHGAEIPYQLSYPVEDGGEAATQSEIWEAEARWSKRSNYSKGIAVDIEEGLRDYAVWVVGFDNATWTTAMKDKLDNYVAEHFEDHGCQVAYLCRGEDELPNKDWLEGAVLAIRWEDVRKWKDPNKGTGGGVRYAGTYDGYKAKVEGYGRRHAASEIKESGLPIYYTEGYQVENGDARALLGINCWVLDIPSTRVAKFRRLFPEAKPLRPALEEVARTRHRQLSKRERRAVALFRELDAENLSMLRSLDPAKVQDGRLREAVRLSQKVWSDKLKSRVALWAKYRPQGRGQSQALELRQYIRDSYPLLEKVYRVAHLRKKSDTLMQHIYIYLNAAFAVAQEQED